MKSLILVLMMAGALIGGVAAPAQAFLSNCIAGGMGFYCDEGMIFQDDDGYWSFYPYP
ncbi:MAG TPA: hypothetical protein VM328_11805 [Fimbriimonadaceae bacterium]|nr:hypothetical protein [Fimbriimonadaceae bacterium]